MEYRRGGECWDLLREGSCELVQRDACYASAERRPGTLRWMVRDHASNMFCSLCPDAWRLPRQCRGTCFQGVDGRGCKAEGACPCFRPAHWRRLRAWDEWLRSYRREDELRRREGMMRQLAEWVDEG